MGQRAPGPAAPDGPTQSALWLDCPREQLPPLDVSHQGQESEQRPSAHRPSAA